MNTKHMRVCLFNYALGRETLKKAVTCICCYVFKCISF